MRRQNRATLNIGNVTRGFFVKTDECAALFHHQADRQPGAGAVSPIRTSDRAQQGLRFEAAQMPKVVFEDALLECELRCSIDMLHAATTANAEMRTSWCDPATGGALPGHGGSRFPTAFAAHDTRLHPFSR